MLLGIEPPHPTSEPSAHSSIDDTPPVVLDTSSHSDQGRPCLSLLLVPKLPTRVGEVRQKMHCV